MSDKSDFQAAEEIKALLAGREKAEQERIVRWVGESLNLVATPLQTAPPAAPTFLPSPAGQSGQHGRAIDIKTFYQTKKPKSELQVASVIGYYFRYEAAENNRKESLTAKELNDASRQARGVGFKDPLKTLSNAVAQGYYDRSGKGSFSLNAVGENLVAMALPGPAAEGKR